MDSPISAPVDEQLQAYNERDIERFMAVYAEDAEIILLPNTPKLKGHTAIRERYTRLFGSSPGLKAVVHNRVICGKWVIDHETVTGASVAGIGEAVVAYQITGGKITNVFLMK